MLFTEGTAYRFSLEDEYENGWVILDFYGYLGNGRPAYSATVFLDNGAKYHFDATEPNGPRGGVGARDGKRTRRGIAELALAVATEKYRELSETAAKVESKP